MTNRASLATFAISIVLDSLSLLQQNKQSKYSEHKIAIKHQRDKPIKFHDHF